MKKTLLSLLVITGIYTVKAQSIYMVKPIDSALNNLYTPFKIKPFTGLNLNKKLNPFNSNLLIVNNMPFHDSMPVAVLEGYSKMPVVKLEGQDNMPVLRLGGNNGDNMEIKGLPGLPTFIAPAKQN